MDMKGSHAAHTENHSGGDDEVEKIESWEPLPREPFDGTVVDIKDTERPPWPSIKEVECITTVDS